MGDRLKDKVAIVTGGAQGVGHGIALAFASEGARIAVLDLDEARCAAAAAACHARGPEAMGVACDVADRGQVDAAVAEVVARFDGVDSLVTCAIAKVIVQPFEVTPPEAFDAMWRVGYLGVVNAMQACLPHLRARRGTVINFASGAGIGAGAGYASYGPIKEAVRCLTHIAAREWGPDAINVNAIAPLAASEQSEEWAAANPEQAALALRSAALGRMGDCELDIGRAAVFLASDDASYVTGHCMMVDGGQRMPL